MKRSLRSTFAVLLAALAFASVGLGARGAAETWTGRTPAPLLRGTGTAQAGLDAQRTLALAFLRTGTPVLGAAAGRPGTLPRVVSATTAPEPLAFHAAHPARGVAAGTQVPPLLRPPFARRLAAARDGTLSARSNGVPPPARA